LSIYGSRVSAITALQMTYFSPQLISGFGADDRLRNFLTDEHIPQLTQGQIQALTIEQIRELRIYSGRRQALLSRPGLLTPAQRQALQ